MFRFHLSPSTSAAAPPRFHLPRPPIAALAALPLILLSLGSVAAKAPTTLPSPPIRIDAGSSASFTDPSGNVWSPDTGFVGGRTHDYGPIAIAHTATQPLFQTERWGMSAYTLPVANGTYTVRLSFSENYSRITAPGQRVFGVDVAGTSLGTLDVFAEAGGRNRAIVKSAIVTVTGGQLAVTFTPHVQNPMINAIEVVPASSAPTATPTPTPPPPPAAASHVYGLVGQGGLGEPIDPALLQQQYAAGVRGRLLELGWDGLQPGGTNDWNSAWGAAFQRRIDAFVATGPDTVLYLDLGLGYAPSWAAATNRLTDQYGATWDPSNGGGLNVYFSPTVRQYVANYVHKIFTNLDFHGRLAIVRVGIYGGELLFPYKSNGSSQPDSFWAYDATAQATSPVPGWRPGQATPHNEAQRFYYWYVDTLTDTFNFVLKEIRKSYAGNVAPVTPGSGMWDTNVATLVARNLYVPGWSYTGTGNFWQRIYARLPPASANVVNWQSSVGDISGTNDSSMNPMDWSSAHQHAYLAHQNGRQIYGENPGRNAYDTSTGADPRTTMQWDFQAMQSYGFAGLMWVRQSDMTNPAYASLQQYGATIARYK